MKLSIAIVTWNRSEQLKAAVESCFACELPEGTQFVIIDNASTDNTAEVVESLFKNKNFKYDYIKMPENIGCGNGRNEAFLHSEGDYVYFLDDDAYVDLSTNKMFFLNAIKILDGNHKIMTLTTQIYDKIWEDNRVTIEGPEISPHLYMCMRFCGGSHFLRRSFWEDTSPYYPNKYGLEEIFPSLRVVDAGFLNVFAPDLRIIHNPKFNKWEKGTSTDTEITVNEVICKLGMKLSIYPRLFHPILYLATIARIYKNLSPNLMFTLPFDTRIKDIQKENKNTKKIRVATVINQYKLFGASVF